MVSKIFNFSNVCTGNKRQKQLQSHKNLNKDIIFTEGEKILKKPVYQKLGGSSRMKKQAQNSGQTSADNQQHKV
jgi:hypothetical protein